MCRIILSLIPFILLLYSCRNWNERQAESQLVVIDKIKIYEDVYSLRIEERICSSWYSLGKPSAIFKNELIDLLFYRDSVGDSLLIANLQKVKFEIRNISDTLIFYDVDEDYKSNLNIEDNELNTVNDLYYLGIFFVSVNQCRSYRSNDRRNVKLYSRGQEFLTTQGLINKIRIDISFELLAKYLTFIRSQEDYVEEVKTIYSKLDCHMLNDHWICKEFGDGAIPQMDYYKELLNSYLINSKEIDQLKIDRIVVPLIL